MSDIKQVQRYDLGQITSVERTPQGFLKVPGFATRVGVFSYLDASGTLRRELRHPDDVFAPESLATLKNAPVTLEHPPEMVTPENIKEYMMGYTTDRVEVNRDLVETDLIIAEEEAITAVEGGLRELSSGYLADLDEEVGTYNGAPYTHRQKNIVYNHLALVKHGRAGPEVRLRLDSADAVMQDDGNKGSEEGSGDTKEIVISGRTLELPKWAADIWESMEQKFDPMMAQKKQMEADQMAEQKKDVDVAQKGVSPQVPVDQMAKDGKSAGAKTDDEASPGVKAAKGLDAEEEKKDEEGKENPFESFKKDMMDAMTAKFDEYAAATMASPKVATGVTDAEEEEEKKDEEEDKKKMDSRHWESRIRTRAKLERNAEKLVPSSVVEKFDSMSDDQIRASVIKHRHPTSDLSDKSSVYLQTRFDTLVESLEEGVTLRKEMGKSLLGGERRDSEPADPDSARRQMIDNSRKLHLADCSAVKK